MPCLSVIVPVYNTEKYLCRCVDSILAQTFIDFELILVDDGSVDSSSAICDDYAQKDSRIVAVHKENKGVSAARNYGMNIATGEYITFVDSDDWIEPNMYSRLLNTAEEFNCDVVMCDCVKDYPDRSIVYTHDIRAGYYDYENLKEEYYPHLIMMENVEYPATISNWLCVFKRCIISSENIRYIDGVRFSEDLLFGAQLMYSARSFYYLKEETYYHYVFNESSASHSFKPDKWRDYCILYQTASKYFSHDTEYDFTSQIDKMLLFFLYNAVGDIRKTDALSKAEKKAGCYEILNNSSVRQMFKRIHVLKLPIYWKLKIITLFYKFGVLPPI